MLPVMILAAVLAAGGSGSSPPRPTYGRLSGEFAPDTPPLKPKDTELAPAAGMVTRLHWEASAAGTDNGEGPDAFTLAVTADGTPICSATIACTTTGDGSATCEGAFVADQDLHLEVTASDCATLPEFVSSATWRQ